MVVLFALLIVAVVGAAVLVAVRFPRAGQLPEVLPDQAVAHVPAEGSLTAQDIADVRFPVALRGYRMADVDALLDRLSLQLPHPDVVTAPALAPQAEPAAPLTEALGTPLTEALGTTGTPAASQAGPATPPTGQDSP